MPARLAIPVMYSARDQVTSPPVDSEDSIEGGATKSWHATESPTWTRQGNSPKT